MTERGAAAERAGAERLHLELDIDSDAPLEGSLSAGDGTSRPFAGWPGLASTLTGFLAEWEQARNRLDHGV